MPNTAGGTTDETIPAPIVFQSKPSKSSNVFTSTPYSSEVRAAIVWMRQCATRLPSRNTPTTVFVLPTSTASSGVVMPRDGSSQFRPVVGCLPIYACTSEDPRLVGPQHVARRVWHDGLA